MAGNGVGLHLPDHVKPSSARKSQGDEIQRRQPQGPWVILGQKTQPPRAARILQAESGAR